MKIKKLYKLTYCSNIFKTNNLKKLSFNIKKYKEKFFKKYNLNVNICLSNNLIKNINKKNLNSFREFYSIKITSINGFVYQNFHLKNIKENIYLPDWTSKNRFLFTKNILTYTDSIAKKKEKISISTLPISYIKWVNFFLNPFIFYEATQNLKKLTMQIKKSHLDIEPEPFCLIESYSDFLKFKKNWIKTLIIKKNEKSLTLCYDICHFSVIFEKQKIISKLITIDNLKIGKIQISIALKTIIHYKHVFIKKLTKTLTKLKKSDFLHQSIIKNYSKIEKFSDIYFFLKKIHLFKNKELRIHCHIPLYKKKFKYFDSTYKDTFNSLNLIKKHNLTKNIEIESYTYHIFFKKFNYYKSIKKEYEKTIIYLLKK